MEASNGTEHLQPVHLTHWHPPTPTAIQTTHTRNLHPGALCPYWTWKKMHCIHASRHWAGYVKAMTKRGAHLEAIRTSQPVSRDGLPSCWTNKNNGAAPTITRRLGATSVAPTLSQVAWQNFAEKVIEAAANAYWVHFLFLFLHSALQGGAKGSAFVAQTALQFCATNSCFQLWLYLFLLLLCCTRAFNKR